jgi:hypothetical protein
MADAEDLELRSRQRRNRLVILAVVAVFLLPFMIAVLWYANVHDWGYETIPHGRFVTPPVALHPPPLPFALGHGRLSPSYFRGRWTLMYLGRPDCQPDCREALYATRQIRLAMGVDITRVQRIYLVLGRPTKTGFLQVEDPDLTVVDAATPSGRRFVARLLHAAHTSLGHEIYVVDPEGRLMMVYPAGADPMVLLHDMQRLLSVVPTA